MKCCRNISFVHDTKRAIAPRTSAEPMVPLNAKRGVLTVWLQQTLQMSANIREWQRQRTLRYATVATQSLVLGTESRELRPAERFVAVLGIS